MDVKAVAEEDIVGDSVYELATVSWYEGKSRSWVVVAVEDGSEEIHRFKA